MSIAEDPGGADRAEPAQIARAIVEAINGRDSERLTALLDPAAEVVTGRSVHAGVTAINAWARKSYDHLERRYAIDETRVAGESVLALGAVQYVWSGGTEVADSTPIALGFELSQGRLKTLRIHDDAAAALAAFEA